MIHTVVSASGILAIVAVIAWILLSKGDSFFRAMMSLGTVLVTMVIGISVSAWIDQLLPGFGQDFTFWIYALGMFIGDLIALVYLRNQNRPGDHDGEYD
ncbi:MAG TPA: hypothetical protein VLI92_00900 [Candidatus Saccharimonadales bacterium]|nr:hypothetical protein [Candidatus Saccharimonadales bacterium]